jgi:hypothetical protein
MPSHWQHFGVCVLFLLLFPLCPLLYEAITVAPYLPGTCFAELLQHATSVLAAAFACASGGEAPVCAG